MNLIPFSRIIFIKTIGRIGTIRTQPTSAMALSNQNKGNWIPAQSDEDSYILVAAPPPGVLADICIPGPPIPPCSERSTDDVVITTFPESWNIDCWEGCPSWDTEIIYELLEAAEEEHWAHIDRKIIEISETARFTSIFCDPSKWWSCHDHFVTVLSEEVTETLKDAEEDFEYESWINSKQYQKSLEEFNFHKLVAAEKRDPSSLWVGECTGDKATTTSRVHPIERTSCVLYETHFKDRFRIDAVIRTEFRENTRGYATASSPYGNIYIPNRFKGYIGKPGTPTNMTVALQDVGDGKRKKPNAFRFTAIYTH